MVMDDILQLTTEEVFELVAELTIRYWRLSRAYLMLKDQVNSLAESKEKELENYRNKVSLLEKEKNDLVLRYNQLESEVISLRSELRKMETLLMEKENEANLLRQKVVELEEVRNSIIKEKKKK